MLNFSRAEKLNQNFNIGCRANVKRALLPAIASRTQFVHGGNFLAAGAFHIAQAVERLIFFPEVFIHVARGGGGEQGVAEEVLEFPHGLYPLSLCSVNIIYHRLPFVNRFLCKDYV